MLSEGTIHERRDVMCVVEKQSNLIAIPNFGLYDSPQLTSHHSFQSVRFVFVCTPIEMVSDQKWKVLQILHDLLFRFRASMTNKS